MDLSIVDIHKTHEIHLLEENWYIEQRKLTLFNGNLIQASFVILSCCFF